MVITHERMGWSARQGRYVVVAKSMCKLVLESYKYIISGKRAMKNLVTSLPRDTAADDDGRVDAIRWRADYFV